MTLDPAALSIDVLGPLVVRVNGQQISVGGPRPRALLSVLAWEAGSVVSVSRLVELVWDGASSDGAANTVQVTVSRLRKAMGSAGSVLHPSAGGYLLDLDRSQVDLHVFWELADAARGHRTAGRLQEAADDLRAALALWRGDPLSELGEAGSGLRARVSARRMAVLGEWAEAELALGNAASVVPELQAAVAAHPMDEGLVAHLMTALYLCGRQGDALAVYTSAAHHLDEELGVDPSPKLRAVHQAVLRQEVVAPSQTPAQTSAPTSTPDAALAALPAQPPVGEPPQRRNPIARPASSFVGRHQAVEQVLAALAAPHTRALTIVGLGGAGKTRLAMEVVAALGPPVEPIVVALAAVERADAVMPEIVRAAGGHASYPGESALEVAARTLRTSPVLLVLDNVEQILDAQGADLLADELDDLLRSCPDLQLLMTSRTPTRVLGEVLFPLGPLELPAEHDLDLEVVNQSPAVCLFADRARAVLPTFEVTQQNAADVVALVRMLDGLPLALELAAARVRMLPPAQMVQRAGPRLGLVSGGSRVLPDRHRSIRAALDWSVALLDPVQRTVFARLGAFSGGWSMAAAELVCADPAGAGPIDSAGTAPIDSAGTAPIDSAGTGPIDSAGTAPIDAVAVVDSLAYLIDQSLVVADGSGRMWLLELVAEYARDLLSAEPKAAQVVRERHLQVYLDLVEELGPQLRLGHDAAARSGLDLDAANITLALDTAAALGDGDRLARLVIVLLDYWYHSGSLADARKWLLAAEAAATAVPVRAQLHLSAGNLALVSADLATAASEFAAAYAAARADENELLLCARAMAARGVVERFAGRVDQALEYLGIASALAQKAGASAMVAIIGGECGELLGMRGDLPEARAQLGQLRDWAVQEGSGGYLATATAGLAMVCLAQGDQGAAAEWAQQALALADQADSPPALADVLTVAAIVDAAGGDAVRAAQRAEQAFVAHHECGQRLALTDALTVWGSALVAGGDLLPGARLLSASDAWREARGLAMGHPQIGALAGEAAATLQEAGEAGVPRVRAAQGVGAATPFGSLAAIRALVAEPLSLEARVIDVRAEPVLPPQ